MELTSNESHAFIELALTRMMAAADRSGDVNATPDLAGANSIFQLVTHCLGVAEYWLHHIIVGAPSHRDRDSELAAVGSPEQIQTSVDEFLKRLPTLLEQVHSAPEIDRAAALPSGDVQRWPMTNAGVLLHVIEELFQHAGHADITADLVCSISSP